MGLFMDTEVFDVSFNISKRYLSIKLTDINGVVDLQRRYTCLCP